MPDPSGFDLAEARKHYSDEEIAAYLAQTGRSSLLAGHGGVTRQGPLDPSLFSESTISPTSGMSDLELTRAGIGRGLVHTGRSVGNLVGLVPNSVLEEEKHTDAPLLATPGGRFGNLVGESAATAPLGMGAGAALERAAPTLAKSLMTTGATQGAVQGAATAEPGDRAKDALVGALTGGTLGAGARGVKSAVYGVERSPAAQRLMSQLPPGTLTPGQMNPTGAMNMFEQASESLGGLKQIVEGARDSAEHAWQTRVIQEGAAPGTKITPSSDMHDMLRQAYESYAPLYDQARGIPVKPAVMNGTQGVKLSAVFGQIAQLPGTTQDARAAVSSWLQNEVSRLPAQTSSDDLLALRSRIRAQARTARLSQDTVAQDKAQLFAAADEAVTRSLNSQLPPQALQALQTADGAYGRYKVLENAVAASKDQVAGLTPAKLSQAVYMATPDQLYALGGGGTLRQLAQDGAQVFQNVSPPTGARAVTLAPAAALAIAHPYAIGVPAVAGGLGMVGTQTGRKLAAGQTMPQQAVQSLTDALGGAASSVPVIGQGLPGAAGLLVARGAQGALAPYAQQAAPAALASALMYAQQQLQPPPEH